MFLHDGTSQINEHTKTIPMELQRGSANNLINGLQPHGKHKGLIQIKDPAFYHFEPDLALKFVQSKPRHGRDVFNGGVLNGGLPKIVRFWILSGPLLEQHPLQKVRGFVPHLLQCVLRQEAAA